MPSTKNLKFLAFLFCSLKWVELRRSGDCLESGLSNEELNSLSKTRIKLMINLLETQSYVDCTKIWIAITQTVRLTKSGLQQQTKHVIINKISVNAIVHWAHISLDQYPCSVRASSILLEKTFSDSLIFTASSRSTLLKKSYCSSTVILSIILPCSTNRNKVMKGSFFAFNC